MKNTLVKNILGLLAFGLVASGAQAGWDRRDEAYVHHNAQQSRQFSQQIDARQDRQMERIDAGMRTGRLTRREYRDLMGEQREIRAMERHFRADGVIDAHEFQRLDRLLDEASADIWAEKHDRQARSRYGDGYRYD